MLAFLFEKEWKVWAQFTAACATESGEKIQTLNVLFLIYSCVKAETFITFIQSYKNLQQVYVGFSYILYIFDSLVSLLCQ